MHIAERERYMHIRNMYFFTSTKMKRLKCFLLLYLGGSVNSCAFCDYLTLLRILENEAKWIIIIIAIIFPFQGINMKN